jgi:hypothetical protein
LERKQKCAVNCWLAIEPTIVQDYQMKCCAQRPNSGRKILSPWLGCQKIDTRLPNEILYPTHTHALPQFPLSSHMLTHRRTFFQPHSSCNPKHLPRRPPQPLLLLPPLRISLHPESPGSKRPPSHPHGPVNPFLIGTITVVPAPCSVQFHIFAIPSPPSYGLQKLLTHVRLRKWLS